MCEGRKRLSRDDLAAGVYELSRKNPHMTIKRIADSMGLSASYTGTLLKRGKEMLTTKKVVSPYAHIVCECQACIDWRKATEKK